MTRLWVDCLGHCPCGSGRLEFAVGTFGTTAADATSITVVDQDEIILT